MISLVVVNYRSASLAKEAIRSAREASRESLQIVAVDNSGDAHEADALRTDADTLLVSQRNRGYAGAINDARPACHGDTLVVCNPDVVFAAGSIDTLAAALDAKTAAAGPALFWDDAHQWLLPPSELHTGSEVLGEALASRSRGLSAARDRRRVRNRIAFWSLRDPTPVDAISGAVMAIRRSAFDAIGGFDERFFLYFEENDFLRRIAARGSRIVYVPAAKCRHVYNQSAGSSPDAPALFATSERRYLEKWNGPFVARTLERLRKTPIETPTDELSGPIRLTDRNVVVEASPLASFGTAAGHFPQSDTVDLPPDVRRSYRGETVYLRVVDRETGQVRAAYRRRARD
jgi:N-acetylglucosaminyl-diphospho-decaprenol L-rhamnosyltransferase